MVTYQVILFFIFCAVYLIFQLDSNVTNYFLIQLDYIKLNITGRFKLWIMLHPKNPIANYLFERKYNKHKKEDSKHGNV
jgi:hypothetical protein